MCRFLGLVLLCTIGSSTLWAQHSNVLISNQNAPNEPSICVNPRNTRELVAGANLRNVYYSHDGGLTWALTAVDCPWGIWGDPVMSVDTTGAFYYLHLSNPPDNEGSWIDRIIAQKSLDGGLSWSDGSYMGLNGSKAQDKQWIATDWHTNQLYTTWTQFDAYGSTSPTDSSNIMFSTSKDGGETWSVAKRINQLAGDCIDEDDTAEGAVPCVGPNGEVYVAWSNRHKIWFDRSLDGGESWLDADVEVAEQPGGWDYKIPGVWRCNGLPVSACDTSDGTHHGTVYVNWTDQRNGTNDTDVWLSKSTDGGATWTLPQRVNDDVPGHHQFFTWMTIDQTNGWLWFVFYDRRHYNDERTDVYMALSKDGGATFINFKVSESPFIPSEDFFMGDYNNITAHENVVRPIWTRMDNGALSVWTALVNPDLVQTLDSPAVIEPLFTLENPAPNPSTDLAGFSFKLKKRALVNLSIVDLQGVVRAQPIREEWRDTGKHLERVYLNQLGLESGVYFFILQVDGQFARKKVLLVRSKT